MGAVASSPNGTGHQQMQKKRFNDHRHNTMPSASPSPTDVDEELIFTENRIYVASPTTTSTTNDSQPIANHNETTSTTHKQQTTKHSFRALANIDCFRKDSSDSDVNSVNRKSCATPASNDTKVTNKEIIFEKVKLNRGDRSTSASPLRSKYKPYDTDSPIHHHFTDSEYDNLNETFYQSQHRPSATTSMARIQYDDDSWDFLAGSRGGDPYQNVVLTPTHAPLSNRRLYEIHYEAAVSSRRSSISTAETWIDDETFDNSFNEELEKRCATYC